jgi:hypothetical protein
MANTPTQNSTVKVLAGTGIDAPLFFEVEVLLLD